MLRLQSITQPATGLVLASITVMIFLVLASLSSLAYQTGSPQLKVEDAVLRADAIVYPAPEYPAPSILAKHAGRVVVEVVIAPATNTSPLARVRSTKVDTAPDTDMANAVLESLKEARYMPFFDERGITEATGRVVWDFRLTGAKPEVIDPYAPPKRPDETPSQLAGDDLRIIRRAREILSSEGNWNRTDNRQCPPNSKTISLYCALEKATQEVTGTFEHRGTVMEDARSAIEEIAPHHPDYGHLLMGYNNDSSTTFADVQKVLQFTEERIKKHITY